MVFMAISYVFFPDSPHTISTILSIAMNTSLVFSRYDEFISWIWSSYWASRLFALCIFSLGSNSFFSVDMSCLSGFFTRSSSTFVSIFSMSPILLNLSPLTTVLSTSTICSPCFLKYALFSFHPLLPPNSNFWRRVLSILTVSVFFTLFFSILFACLIISSRCDTL